MGGKVGLFGGHGLLTFGALIVLFAFMLPWASCSGVRLSGLDIVTSGSDYNGDASWSVLALVPLGALALLALGIIGIAVNLLGKKMPAGLTRLTPFLPCPCWPLCLGYAAAAHLAPSSGTSRAPAPTPITLAWAR